MKTFEELGVSAELRRAIEELGFEAPMPVQEAVIPVLLTEQRDIIALAQTGTGKTATFGLPLLQKIGAPSNSPFGGEFNEGLNGCELSPARRADSCPKWGKMAEPERGRGAGRGPYISQYCCPGKKNVIFRIACKYRRYGRLSRGGAYFSPEGA